MSKELERQLLEKGISVGSTEPPARDGISEIAKHMLGSIVGGKSVVPTFTQYTSYTQSGTDGPHPGPYTEAIVYTSTPSGGD